MSVPLLGMVCVCVCACLHACVLGITGADQKLFLVISAGVFSFVVGLFSVSKLVFLALLVLIKSWF